MPMLANNSRSEMAHTQSGWMRTLAETKLERKACRNVPQFTIKLVCTILHLLIETPYSRILRRAPDCSFVSSLRLTQQLPQQTDHISIERKSDVCELRVLFPSDLFIQQSLNLSPLILNSMWLKGWLKYVSVYFQSDWTLLLWITLRACV